MAFLLNTLKALALPALLLAAPAAAQAQSAAPAAAYPTKDITVVCTFPAGSGADVLVRYFAEKLKPFVAPHAVIVENKTGGAGSIGMTYAKNQPADGHTLLLDAGSSIAAVMARFETPPFDAAKDFQMAATLNRQSFLVMVAADSPYKTLADLTADMKAKGDKASYGTAATSGIALGELYRSLAGLETVQVLYGTSSETLNDLTSGQLAFATLDPVFSLAQMREGRLRALGIGSGERIQAIPDVPTMREQGVDIDIESWWSVSVPAGTPDEAVMALNGWFEKILSSEDTKAFLNKSGGDVFISTPEEAQKKLEANLPLWEEIIKIAKIKPLG